MGGVDARTDAGLEIRTAGSRREEPLCSKTQNIQHRQLSTNASAYHTRQVAEGNPLALSLLAG
jgi:hypothetical protein